MGTMIGHTLGQLFAHAVLIVEIGTHATKLCMPLNALRSTNVS